MQDSKQKDLNKQLEVFKRILDTLPNSIYLKDINGRYLWLNKASIGQLESKHLIVDPIVGKTDFEVFPLSSAIKYHENDQKVIKNNKGICIEEEVILQDGQTLTQLSFKEPLYNGTPSKLIGVLGYTIDITETKKNEEELRKEKEKAEAASKTKTEFLENMRHNIRTPLIGIVGSADIIRNEAEDPIIKEHANNLVASSYALLDFLNGILEAIKVSSGEIPLLKKRFNLEDKLKQVVLLNQATAAQKDLDLLFEYDADIPYYLIGDPIRIHRIVLELVTNALNFTHRGYVRLSAQLAHDKEEEAIIKIVVEDTGIGIAPERQQELYVQFKRFTPSYEGIYKGSGLGLSIIKQFVDELQGEIYLESRIAQGSQFTFIIKLKKPLLNAGLASKKPIDSLSQLNFVANINSIETIQNTKFLKSRILLVEDSRPAAKIASYLLSSLGCHVDLAETGEQAVQLACTNFYDLIFMDIGLPDIDGYEATKRIRLHQANKKQAPIIALTAHIDEENEQHCLNMGMSTVLVKPLIKEEAARVLNLFLPLTRSTYEGNASKVLAQTACLLTEK